jgi:hypothetical protein
MAAITGLNCKLFRGEAGATATELVENVKDITLNLEQGEAESTTRKSNGWKTYIPTIKEASVEFQINYDTEDEDFGAFSSAFLTNAPIALFITDGGGMGLDADFHITSFSLEQPLEDVVTVSITAKPTDAKRAPEWNMGA